MLIDQLVDLISAQTSEKRKNSYLLKLLSFGIPLLVIFVLFDSAEKKINLGDSNLCQRISSRGAVCTWTRASTEYAVVRSLR